ncbi:MAG: glycosyltransferase family 4 protein [Flavobacteriaceae bacterium]|nr:glycosyltransferase family 4 protein [Flavobacteriaceae bacterium]
MNRQPVVLQLTDSLEAGGAEVVAINIANALNHRKISSHLAVSRKEGSLKNRLENEVGYYFLNRTKLIDFRAFQKLHQYINQHRITILHAHASSWFLAVVMKLWNPSVKIVWHDHFGFSEQLHKRNSFPIKMGSIFFKTTISVNQILLDWAKKSLYAKYFYYLPNFVMKTRKNTAEKPTILAGKSGKRIICLANLRPQKDHLNLLNAFKMMHQGYPNWTLHLIGNKSDLKYYNEIQAFINQNNLKEHVWIYGDQSDVSLLLTQADIGVLSSKSEGLPLALLEYGMAKLGVVVTNVGDCAEVLDNGKNGCLVHPSNAEEFAQKMIFLINNEQERKTRGENLYQKVQTTYSEEAVCRQLLNIYYQLV